MSQARDQAGGGADQLQPFEMRPGVSYFMVLEPSKVLGPGGEKTYAMLGPFLDLGTASQFAIKRPGSLITVTLCLHANPAAAAPSLLQPKGSPG